MIMPPVTYEPEKIAQIIDGMGHGMLPREVPSYEYGLLANDGLDLLRGRTDANSRVYSLDVVNPFPFALQLPAARANPCSAI